MKKVFILSMLGLSFVYSTGPMATEKLIDYKCYVESTIGYEINFYSWKPSKTQLMIAKLPATKYKLGKHDVYIKEVVECVELDDTFQNINALAKDLSTVR
jgi:hypothetical protein